MEIKETLINFMTEEAYKPMNIQNSLECLILEKKT